MDDQTPYEELDLAVVELCRTINRLPGLLTIGSCGGHEGGGQTEEQIEAGAEYRGELPADEWRVTFQLESPGRQRRPTVDAWLSLEWVVWMIENAMRGNRVNVVPYAPPPFLNEPGRCLRFTIFGSRSGQRGVEADEVARFLEKAEASVMAGPPE